jgi:hypothetical protein
MLTLDRKQQPPTLRERRAMRPLLLGGLLYVGLAIVPLSADAPLTLARVLGLALLLGAAALLVVLGLPRTRHRALPARASSIARSEDRPLRLELVGDVMPPVYRAELVHGDGSRELLLERSDPAGVLTDAVELARALEVPLSPGWGLDQQALDELTDPVAESALERLSGVPLEVESPTFAGQRNAAFTTLWAAAFVLTATVVMSESARATVSPGALSVALPCLGAILVLLVGLWILGLRGRLVIGRTGASRERSWFKWQLGPSTPVEGRIHALAHVAPPGSDEGHVVLATSKGYVAFLVRGTMPQALQLRGASPASQTRAAE